MARKRKPITQRLREAYNVVFGYGSRDGGILRVVGHGGIRTATGAGTAFDKSSMAYYVPSVWQPTDLEIIYQASWAAARAIDMPVDDMFLRTPEFKAPKKKTEKPTGPGKSEQQRMREAEEENEDDPNEKLVEAIRDCNLYMHVKDAMKAGRLHGTGMMIVAVKGQAFHTPLDIDGMLPNDLIGFFTVDRWSASVETYQENIMKARYSQPETYLISISVRGTPEWIRVHHSRIFRFDAIRPISKRNFGLYQDRDFGTSEYSRIFRAITDEEIAVKGITHLTQEASIPVVKSAGFKDSLEQGNFTAGGADEVSTEQIAEEINRMLSTYRILFADADGDVSRVNVPFGGIPDLLSKYAERIAMAVGIPVTRFLCKSPIGLQSTGSGEERDYARIVASNQENQLRPMLDKLFAIIGKSIGMEVPKYTFPSIIDISDAEKAETGHKWIDAAKMGVEAGIMDENEAREMIQCAVPECNHLDPLDESQLEEMRNDPVLDAQIAELESRANRNNQPPPSNNN